MRVFRTIVLAGAAAAAGYLMRRQGLLGGRALPSGTEPTSPAPAQPPSRADDAPTVEAEPVRAPEEGAPADVTEVVDDLLGGVDPIMDAEVVEDAAENDDAAVERAVWAALTEESGLLGATIDVEVDAGTVYLRGELDRPDLIGEAERRAATVRGVSTVENLLHLPGTPPPRAGAA